MQYTKASHHISVDEERIVASVSVTPINVTYHPSTGHWEKKVPCIDNRKLVVFEWYTNLHCLAIIKIYISVNRVGSNQFKGFIFILVSRILVPILADIMMTSTDIIEWKRQHTQGCRCAHSSQEFHIPLRWNSNRDYFSYCCYIVNCSVYSTLPQAFLCTRELCMDCYYRWRTTWWFVFKGWEE